jgi:Double-GTPase 2
MPLLNQLSQKITCPFCFAEFSAQELRFRCIGLSCTGRAVDEVYARARGLVPTNMGRVLTPGKRAFGLPRVVECDVCKKETRTRICPTCHFELSHDVGQIDQRIIAIIGGSNTGKSHYIAALITRLQHEVGANFKFSVSMIGDGTRERWLNDFYIPLFERKSVLQPTQGVQLDSRVKIPLIFRLTLSNGNHIRALNLSFFDTAGEDMTALALDTLSVEARYISQADGVIVLLDPLQIGSVRQKLPYVNTPPPDPKARPEFIVARLRELFERRENLPANKKVPVPIAFTLSKVDTLLSIVEPGSALQRPSEHFGLVDLTDVQSVSTEISNYLREWIDPNFCNTIENQYANYRYFGVSSLGGQPVNAQLDTVNPLRVEDPFLWILYQLKLVKGKEMR